MATRFLPHVCIDQGTIQATREVLLGDLLHEAGHLAVMPARFRPLMSGNLYRSLREISAQLEDAAPDNPDLLGFINADDQAATAWSWAVGIHLGMDPLCIIESAAFGGEGDDIRLLLSVNQHYGIHALQASEFCAVRKISAAGRPVFPHLAFWLKP
ncbi:hypothetical protein HAP94_13925 [Acidithiobacillus ferrivorans]|nr:hypothetical protein [Acidithiobacillus ferrivorans]